ncbi:hypothetical protein Tco_1263272 [Tanacetum coccineum]
MADLTFADSHNMVAEIVDFLNASPIRRDLHFNDEDDIICLANTKIFENLQLMGSKSTAWNEFGTNIASAVICLAKKQKFNFSKLIFDVFNDEYDTPSHTKKVFANIRRKEKDFSGTVTPLFATMLIQSQAVEGEADETVHEERGDSVERAATTATSLDAEQGSGNINMTQSTAIPNDPFPQGISSSSSPRRQDTMGDRPAQTSMKLQELMDLCTKLSDKVLDLENVKNAQALEIQKLKKRVKKLESKKKSRTPQLKRRLFKGRNEINQDEGISWFQEDSKTQGRYGHDIGVNTASTSITTASINITTAEPVTTDSAPITTAGVSVSTVEPKKSKEKGVSSKIATRLARGVIVKEASETATRPTVPPPQIDLKDKGKVIMQEPKKPVKVKGKDQIEYDADDDVQAMMDADYELAAKLQAEEQGEIYIEERSKLFVELMNERKKHFARLRAEEQRRKPLTKAQKRN